ARFRENAARALLLPRRHPGRRSPLWQQRKRAADLLAVAARYGSFPIILETYREALRDVFDLPGLKDILTKIASRSIRVVTRDTRTPSPFAASLLFSYVANFIYDADAPLAERRAQALSVDQAQLRELLGEAELRELFDPGAIESLERSLQRLEGRRVRHADGLHDLLLSLGDLSEEEIRQRSETPEEAPRWLEALVRERRVIPVRIAGEARFAAAEDAGRLRDALGIVPPPGLPAAFLESAQSGEPVTDLVSRYARTHGPFRLEDAAARWGLPVGVVRLALDRLAERGRVVEGEFLPGGRSREWSDAGTLRAIKRRSLAKLRREVEPVEPAAFARFLAAWQSVAEPRAGLEALLSAVEQLQGYPIPASTLETEVLPARVERYRPADLDSLLASGEIVWRGLEPLGPSDGRVAFYLTDRASLLAPPARPLTAAAEGPLAAEVSELLGKRGALFFPDLVAETGAFAGDLVAVLWNLVWAGEISNDTLAPLRSLLAGASPKGGRRARGRSFRSRRLGPPGSEGRWFLVPAPRKAPTDTERRAALSRALLERHGVLTREAVAAEGIAGGFSTVYPVLKAMEEAGQVRRGYFVAGLGATQFALAGADDRLRGEREAPEPDAARTLVLAATDPANPYGAALPWPSSSASDAAARPQRAAGAQVVLRSGELLAWIGRTETNLLTFLPADEPARAAAARELARALARLVESGRRRAVLVGKVDGKDPRESPLAPHLVEAGFLHASRGYLKRLSPGPTVPSRSLTADR
ncbi:MAG: crosslink repair DNA glycosylase YcaQ family protein, partial [Thermoanaerobaculia bacterium]